MQPIPCHFHYDCSSQLLPIQNSPRVTSSNEKPVWRSATFGSTDFPPLAEKLMGLRRHFGSGGGALCSDFQKRTQRERPDGRRKLKQDPSTRREKDWEVSRPFGDLPGQLARSEELKLSVWQECKVSRNIWSHLSQLRLNIRTNSRRYIPLAEPQAVFCQNTGWHKELTGAKLTLARRAHDL